MRYCICGKAIQRRKEKGHREREYCSDACRQRANRERNKHKRTAEQSMEEAMIRIYDASYQEIHHETWQDDVERQERLIHGLLDENIFLHEVRDTLLGIIDRQEATLAEKDAEIVRLTFLLDAQSQKKR
jgi:hypothetical protein